MTAEGAKELGDVVSATVAFGTVAQILPSIAALFTILWTAIRIYEWVRSRRLND